MRPKSVNRRAKTRELVTSWHKNQNTSLALLSDFLFDSQWTV